MLVAGYVLAAGTTALGVTRTKANNADNLNLTTSWTGGAIPGSGDIALWNSTVTSANTVSLGADLNFGEIQISNPSGFVAINAGNTLTLSGVSGVGIDMSSASQNLFLFCAITLGASQSWNVASGRNLVLFSSAALNTAGNLLTITGAGVTEISSVISGAGGLTYSGAGNQGFLYLDGSNKTYTGVTTLDGGQTVISTLADVNVTSSIGKGSVAGSAADLVFGGGVLYYSPSASAPTSTNRLFTIGDANGLTATLFSDNSNPANTMSFTGTGAIAFGGSGVRTLTLSGNNTGNNTFAPILGDGPGGATSLTKFGFGTWILTAFLTFNS